jgi:hypothetical protein
MMLSLVPKLINNVRYRFTKAPHPFLWPSRSLKFADLHIFHEDLVRNYPLIYEVSLPKLYALFGVLESLQTSRNLNMWTHYASALNFKSVLIYIFMYLFIGLGMKE